MTLREGAVISTHTEILLCESFQPVHEYIEKILGEAIQIHQIPMCDKEIKEKSKTEFDEIVKSQTRNNS